MPVTSESAPDARRSVELSRTGLGRYVVRNARGVEVEFGHGDDLLSPVELLLAAIGGCSAIDLDYITHKRAEPTEFTVTIDASKTTDEGGGHRLGDVHVDFHVRFADNEAGAAALGVVERSIAQSRDRLCTVSRTVTHETPVTFTVDNHPIA